MMEVTGLPLDELMAQARQVRDLTTGTRITYSPKVFIPLTMLCRDRCGYCTFAQPPARLDSPFLEPDQVLRIARAGARAGCHEALFTLGEAPEDRYPVALGHSGRLESGRHRVRLVEELAEGDSSIAVDDEFLRPVGEL